MKPLECHRKTPVARGGRLSSESTTKFGTRLENVHARAPTQPSLRPTSRRDRAYVAWVLGHFHETTDENSSRLLCPPERVRAVAVRVLFRSSPSRRSRIHAPGGWWMAGRSARPGFDRVEAAEDSHGDSRRSIHAGNRAGCCASRVEIERRAGKRSAQKCQAVKVGGGKKNIVTPAFTWDRLGQGRARSGDLIA